VTLDTNDYIDEPSNPIIQQAVKELMSRNWRRVNDPRIKAVPVADWPAYAQALPPSRVLIVLDGERPFSWNKYWSGMHWSKRSAEKDRVQMLVRAELDPNVQMFAQPVEIRVRAFFKGNVQDCSNICIKPYEDAIIGWLIKDDSPDYVTAVRVESRKDNKRPRVEIEVVAVGQV
jgi:hypothetical protein